MISKDFRLPGWKQPRWEAVGADIVQETEPQPSSLM